MSTWTILRKAWNDSVWSKVIAAGITAALAAIVGALATYGELLAKSRPQILRLIDAPVVMPAWSLAALGLLIAVLAWLSLRRRPKAGTTDDIHPNAVPITEAHLLVSPMIPTDPRRERE